MLNLTELLSLPEKKRLRQLTWLSLGLVVLLMVSLFLWSQRLNSLRQQADFGRQELDKVSAEREKARQELARWTNTQKELEELKATAFYPGPGALDKFRDDLFQIFNKSGLPVPPINYQYEEASAKQKKIKKLTASFSLKLSYPSWKKFLYEVETWPKWLTIDQVNFQKIDENTGLLDLRLAISGYLIEGAAQEK
jgi:Tfp pilus assembly protein PilO